MGIGNGKERLGLGGANGVRESGQGERERDGRVMT